MRIPLRSAGLLAIVSLPFVLAGCQTWSFLLCLIGGVSVSGTTADGVATDCGVWVYAFAPSSTEGDEEEALDVVGTGAAGAYESGPNVWQTGSFSASLDVAVDRESPLTPLVTRQYLRVEDDAVPPHFVQIEATWDGGTGFQISTRNESAVLTGPTAMPITDVVTMRIVRDAGGYHLSAQSNAGAPLSLIDVPDAATSALARLRFGADNLADGARVQFHALTLQAATFGDATFSPIFSRLASALDDLADAAAVATGPATDFTVAETELGQAETLLSEALELLIIAKQDGSITKPNQPKLARAALSKARKRATQGGNLAEALANGGGGKQKKLQARIDGARALTNLAFANLLGVKTKNAKKVSKHVELSN